MSSVRPFSIFTNLEIDFSAELDYGSLFFCHCSGPLQYPTSVAVKSGQLGRQPLILPHCSGPLQWQIEWPVEWGVEWAVGSGVGSGEWSGQWS